MSPGILAMAERINQLKARAKELGLRSTKTRTAKPVKKATAKKTRRGKGQ